MDASGFVRFPPRDDKKGERRAEQLDHDGVPDATATHLIHSFSRTLYQYSVLASHQHLF